MDKVSPLNYIKNYSFYGCIQIIYIAPGMNIVDAYSIDTLKVAHNEQSFLTQQTQISLSRPV